MNESVAVFDEGVRWPDGVANAALPDPCTRCSATRRASDGASNHLRPMGSGLERIPVMLPGEYIARLLPKDSRGPRPTGEWESHPRQQAIFCRLDATNV